MAKLVITGATGSFGKQVVNALLTKVPAGEIAVSVRNIAKAESLFGKGIEFRYGDYSDPGSLVRSFVDASRLLLIPPPGADPLARIHIETRILEAAQQSGVGHILYSSLAGTYPAPLHAARSMEHMLLSTGIPATILRNASYQELFLNDRLFQYVRGELILTSAGKGRVNAVSIDDLAEATANAMLQTDDQTRIYTLSMPSGWTFNQFARMLTNVTGKTIVHEAVDEEKLRLVLQKAGLPPVNIESQLNMYRHISRGDFNEPSEDLRPLLGKKPVSMQESLKKYLARKKIPV